VGWQGRRLKCGWPLPENSEFPSAKLTSDGLYVSLFGLTENNITFVGPIVPAPTPHFDCFISKRAPAPACDGHRPLALTTAAALLPPPPPRQGPDTNAARLATMRRSPATVIARSRRPGMTRACLPPPLLCPPPPLCQGPDTGAAPPAIACHPHAMTAAGPR
jgi:hypothetical protein